MSCDRPILRQARHGEDCIEIVHRRPALNIHDQDVICAPFAHASISGSEAGPATRARAACLSAGGFPPRPARALPRRFDIRGGPQALHHASDRPGISPWNATGTMPSARYVQHIHDSHPVLRDVLGIQQSQSACCTTEARAKRSPCRRPARHAEVFHQILCPSCVVPFRFSGAEPGCSPNPGARCGPRRPVNAHGEGRAGFHHAERSTRSSTCRTRSLTCSR